MSTTATFDSSLVSGSLIDSRGITGITTINPITTAINTHPIQGQMLSVKYQTSEFDMINIDTDAIKQKLAHMIADELLKSKYLEFTSQHDIATGNRIFRARLFAVPDTQVRLLREAKIS